MVGKSSSKSRILSGVVFSSLFAVFGLSFVPAANAAVGDCQDANLSFDKTSYKAGDRVTLNGSNSGGTWTLCIYEGNERIAVTVNSTDDQLSVNLPDTYMGEELTGVIRPNGVCGNDLDSASNCRVTANDNGAEEPVAGGNEDSGDADTGGATNNVGGGSLNGEAGGATKAAGSSETVSVNVDNPLETDDFTELLGNFLEWLLGIVGSIALLMLIYGGVVYMSANGDPQKAETGKRIVIWTIGGLMIVLLSYSILSTVEDIFVN
jgi:hypothetical protein